MSFYHPLRDQFLQEVRGLCPECDVMSNNVKVKYVMSESLVKETSEYIYFLLF